MSIKFNPFTSNFDFIGDGDGSAATPQNFSYTLIDSGDEIEVPYGQQMIVDGHVRVLGHLLISGDVIDISNRQVEKFFYDRIPSNDTVTVYENRLLMFKNHMVVDGHIRVSGRLAEV